MATTPDSVRSTSSAAARTAAAGADIIKTALASRIEALREEAKNPVTKSPLYPYRDELRTLKVQLGLSNPRILSELKDAGVDTTDAELKKFFKAAGLSARGKKSSARSAASS